MSILHLCILAAMATACTAASQPQDPKSQQPTGRGATTGAAAARMAAVEAEVGASAAALQLAGIRLSMGTMLIDAVVTKADEDQDPQVASYREDQILTVVARQLEEFILKFPGTDQAEGARALLATIYVHLSRTSDAARVLKDFDAERADASDLLKTALSVAPIAELASKVDEWLQIVATTADVVTDKVDAVFVAVQLGKMDLADALLRRIRADATSLEVRAAVVLAEAELAAKIASTGATPIVDPLAIRKFVTNPLAGVQVSVDPTGTWRKVAAVDASLSTSDALLKTKAAKAAAFLASNLYLQVVSDAADGMKSRKLRAVVDSDAVVIDERFIPYSSDQAPAVVPPVEVVVDALLHKLVHYYPGTDAARIAAARVQADAMVAGSPAVSIDATTLDGKRVTLEDYRGEVVLLDFFSLSDPQCIAEREEIKELKRQFQGQEFEILSVSLEMDEDRWLVMAAADAFDMSWPILFDGKGIHSDVARKYGVDTLPARLLIDRNGKVFEDRAWRLKTDVLPQAVDAALLQPKLPLPLAEQATIGAPLYVGPEVEADLQVDASAPTKLEVEASVWVVDANTSFRLARVEVEAAVAKVYLDLVVPASPTIDPEGLQQRKVKVPLPQAELQLVHVYVKQTVQDAAYAKAPQPALAQVLPVSGSFTSNYQGPKILYELLSTDSIPPEYSLLVSADLPSEEFKIRTDKIVRGTDITQVLLTIDGPAELASKDPAVRQRVHVPLGTDVAGRIEILVDYRPLRDPKSPPKYDLAVWLPRN